MKNRNNDKKKVYLNKQTKSTKFMQYYKNFTKYKCIVLPEYHNINTQCKKKGYNK